MGSREQDIAGAVRTILIAMGEDPDREGLMETPLRVARAYKEWFRGYEEPSFRMTMFDTDYGGLVVRKAIPFQSFCEHHMAMYKGTIDFGYIPNGKMVGLSKIPRLFQHKASILSSQEMLTDLLVDEFEAMFPEGNKPVGTIVVVTARHSCESSRGIKVDAPTITSSVRGKFKQDLAPRDEFLSLIKHHG
jgi:GTP cyclohydrolase IA